MYGLAHIGFRVLLGVAIAALALIGLVVLVPATVLVVTPAYALGAGPAVLAFALLVLITFHRPAIAAFWQQLLDERRRRGLRS